MNNKTIQKKGKSALVWIYKNITNKFTHVFGMLQDRFPSINRFPLLKYSLIPLFLGLFFAVRYILKLGINELATWSSNFVGETSGITVPASTIVLSLAASIIVLRLGFRLWSQKKKKSNVEELNYESRK